MVKPSPPLLEFGLNAEDPFDIALQLSIKPGRRCLVRRVVPSPPFPFIFLIPLLRPSVSVLPFPRPPTDMLNIFETFLPQLLRYPNPSDPLNNEAATLLMRDPPSYNAKVKDFVNRFATAEQVPADGEEQDDDDESGSGSDGSEDGEMSDMGSLGDEGEEGGVGEVNGRMDL